MSTEGCSVRTEQIEGTEPWSEDSTRWFVPEWAIAFLILIITWHLVVHPSKEWSFGHISEPFATVGPAERDYLVKRKMVSKSQFRVIMNPDINLPAPRLEQYLAFPAKHTTPDR